jgi:hypothetical protein
MRSSLGRCFVALALSASAAVIGGPSHWKKPYFTATKPGTFARSQGVDAVSGDVTEAVLTRLPDEDGRVVFERSDEFKTGRFKGTKSVSRYVMKPGFPMDLEGLSYMRWAGKVQWRDGSGTVTDGDAATVEAIASQGTDFGAIAVFKGTETFDGKSCDHYAYTAASGPGKVNGELWLSDQVPFATVKETLRGKDATGAEYRIETKLVETGVSAAAAKAAAQPAVTLVDLFRAGKISILVEIVPKSSRVWLTITNKGETRLKVVVPKGTTTLVVGSPVDTLILVADAERALEIPAHGTAARFDLTQKGTYRPTKGAFTASVFEGQPLFSGSVEMDHVKE